MKSKSDEQRVIDVIQAEYKVQLSRPAAFMEGIQLRVENHRRHRNAMMTIGILVLGMGFVFEGFEGGKAEKSQVVLPVETEAAKTEGAPSQYDDVDWWESGVDDDDDDDDVYPEEFQALALLVIDPMYENRNF